MPAGLAHRHLADAACIAALVQAAGGLPDLQRLIVFSLGALLMRGIGCTVNDMCDRDFDKHVERTRFRP